MRQAFYETLHPPFLTNTNGNCRSHSLRIMQAVNVFEPGIISVPVDKKGRETFKLDRLAPTNGINHSAAHDAMGDVEAMVHMCSILAEHADGHWSNFVRFAPEVRRPRFCSGRRRLLPHGFLLRQDILSDGYRPWPES
ncbi:MAG TPA: hypothetical protein VLS27_07460 [Gammaproteobacteria bacterium]|nr:hypothetical protein [Gammaproteobacteria bacterium]